MATAEPCLPPDIPAPPAESNMFTEQQEMWLGEVLAQHLERDYRLVSDPASNAYLQSIGQRLLQGLPTGMKFEFRLVDLPMVNAFTLPGGRIYVTRKLVAAAQNEDEVAMVLGHEIGHALTRQPAMRMTIAFRAVGINAVGDRADVYAKYNQVLDNELRNPGVLKKLRRNERDEALVDRIGIYAATRAGYHPEAGSEFWDRLSENQGHVGSWLSDLFGATHPESRRYRELTEDAAKLPPGCISPRTGDRTAFESWRSGVITAAMVSRPAMLRGIVVQKKLDPALRPDIEAIRFSPDGKYLLAQDESAIHVFTHLPLQYLFTIDADGARPASFTPDSHSILFHTPSLRVERWNVATRQREQVKEVATFDRCLRTLLSPWGDRLACLTADFDVKLLDVATGATTFEKKQFYAPGLPDFLRLLTLMARNADEGGAPDLQFPFGFAFSPDGSYFLAGRAGETLVVEVATAKIVNVPGSVRDVLSRSFGFLASNRLVGMTYGGGETRVVSFPDGRVLKKDKVWASEIAPATKGDYVLLLPIRDYAVGIEDVNADKIVIALKHAAVDVYGEEYARESKSGELGLFHLSDGNIFARAAIPVSNLGRLYAAAASPDLRWLAISGHNRGGEWDLQTMQRPFHIRGFEGAFLQDDGSLVADIPPEPGKEDQKRAIVRFEPASGRIAELQTLDSDTYAYQQGPYVLQLSPAKKNAPWRDVTLSMRNEPGTVLWTRVFPKERPTIEAGDGKMLVLLWRADEEGGRLEIEKDAGLLREVGKVRKGDYLAQVVDPGTGNVARNFYVRTGEGSFLPVYGVADKAVLAVQDNRQRTVVYSMMDGRELTKIFGTSPVLSESGMLAVRTDQDEITLYDQRMLQAGDPYVFPSPVSYAQFSGDGKRLLVVTADQTVYVLSTPALGPPQQQTSAN